MAILSDTTEEQLDAAVLLDLLFVRLALADEILGVSVQQVDLGRRNVDYDHGDCPPNQRTERKEEKDQRTVREEVLEHEGVVGLWVVLGKPDVFIHVEGDDVLEAGRTRSASTHSSTIIRTTTTYESSPALCSLIKAWYVGMGEDPVGKPRTKGFSAVGSNSLILIRKVKPNQHEVRRPVQGENDEPFRDVVGDVIANLGRVLADDETYSGSSRSSTRLGNDSRLTHSRRWRWG